MSSRSGTGAAGDAGVSQQHELLTAADVARTAARMAHQIIERTGRAAPVLLRRSGLRHVGKNPPTSGKRRAAR